MKKSDIKKLQRKKPVSEIKTKSESIAHYNAILIEELKGEFKAVAEGLHGLDQKIDRKFDELDQKIENVRTELKEEIRYVYTTLSGEIVDIKSEINHPEYGLKALHSEINHPEYGLKALHSEINHPEYGLKALNTKIINMDEKVTPRLEKHEEAIIELQESQGFKPLDQY